MDTIEIHKCYQCNNTKYILWLIGWHRSLRYIRSLCFVVFTKWQIKKRRENYCLKQIIISWLQFYVSIEESGWVLRHIEIAHIHLEMVAIRMEKESANIHYSSSFSSYSLQHSITIIIYSTFFFALFLSLSIMLLWMCNFHTKMISKETSSRREKKIDCWRISFALFTVSVFDGGIKVCLLHDCACVCQAPGTR